MRYSISDLERLSGIHTHTIRMWEQRYNALSPVRSAGNTRYYDDHQLIRLLNIVTASQRGMKISQICSLSEEAMRQLIEKEIKDTLSPDQQYEIHISQLLNFGITYDEPAFSTLLSTCIQRYGLKATYKEIIYPLLTRLGLMWQKETVCAAQEHFLTNIIRQKIFSGINDLIPADRHARTWLLFLPEDEAHEIGLLFANYLLRQSGQRVIYLGSRVPLESLKEVMESNRVDRMMLFIVQNKLTSDCQQYLENLSSIFIDTQIHLAGNTRLIEHLSLPENIHWFKNIEQFETTINPVTCH